MRWKALLNETLFDKKFSSFQIQHLLDFTANPVKPPSSTSTRWPWTATSSIGPSARMGTYTGRSTRARCTARTTIGSRFNPWVKRTLLYLFTTDLSFHPPDTILTNNTWMKKNSRAFCYTTIIINITCNNNNNTIKTISEVVKWDLCSCSSPTMATFSSSTAPASMTSTLIISTLTPAASWWQPQVAIICLVILQQIRFLKMDLPGRALSLELEQTGSDMQTTTHNSTPNGWPMLTGNNNNSNISKRCRLFRQV